MHCIAGIFFITFSPFHATKVLEFAMHLTLVLSYQKYRDTVSKGLHLKCANVVMT